MSAVDRARRFSEDLRHQEERELHKFNWPCAKRRPHGKHWIPAGEDTWPPQFGDNHDFDCEDDDDCGCGRECPGVRAHPATQIGGSHDAW